MTIDLRPGLCTCGCEQTTERRFRPGHDARLKSRLRDAYRNGHPVEMLVGPHNELNTSAIIAASYLDSPTFSWSNWLSGSER